MFSRPIYRYLFAVALAVLSVGIIVLLAHLLGWKGNPNDNGGVGQLVNALR